MHDIQGIFCNYSISYDYNLITHTHTHTHAHYLYSFKCRTVFKVQNSLTQHDSTFCHAAKLRAQRVCDKLRSPKLICPFTLGHVGAFVLRCCNGWDMLGCSQDEPIAQARNARHVCDMCLKGLKGGTGSLQISCSLR